MSIDSNHVDLRQHKAKVMFRRQLAFHYEKIRTSLLPSPSQHVGFLLVMVGWIHLRKHPRTREQGDKGLEPRIPLHSINNQTGAKRSEENKKLQCNGTMGVEKAWKVFVVDLD